MNILLIFATSSGGTQLASDIATETLRTKNHEVTQINARDASPDQMQQPDLVILASPSWDYEGREGEPHEDMLAFMEKCKGKDFAGKKFAILGLGDNSYMHFCGAVDHLEKFVEQIKGTRTIESLRIDGFYFNQEANEQKVRTWIENLAGILQGGHA